MAFDYPEDLKYLDTHEYARLEGDIVTVGITAFAVDQLGDVVFVDYEPQVGDTVTKGTTFGTVESVKAVEDLKAPVSGTVIERNEGLLETPEKIADDPYGACWMIKVRVSDPSELDTAMSAAEYRTKVEGA
jgi:glycine cleavage system H protein